jgi:tetratricopeptide (TPR) repeat protein
MVPDEHNDLYGAIAEAYAAVGNGQDAVRCLRHMRLGDGSMIDASAQRVAQSLAASGDIEHALQVADIALGPPAKAAALASVAGALLDAGDEPSAVKMARRAIRAAEMIEDHGSGAAALASLTTAIADNGDKGLAALTLERARAALDRVLPGARAEQQTRPVIDALVQQGRFDDALAIADGEYPDLLAIARIALGLAGAGDGASAIALAGRVLADAPGSFAGVEALVTAASVFRRANRHQLAAECLAVVRLEDDDVIYIGCAVVRGLREAGRLDDATEAARRMAGLPEVPPRVAADLLAAAGLTDDATARVRDALTRPEEDTFVGNDLGLSRRAGLAALLPRDEAIGVLADLRAAAAEIPALLWRCSVLTVIAGELHRVDTALAAAVLRDAFLTGWLAGRRAVMDAIVNGPLVDLGPNLPEQLASLIPEVDAWWTDDGAV